MDFNAKQLVMELLHRTAYLVDEKRLSELPACFDRKATFELSVPGSPEPARFNGIGEIMGLMQATVDAQNDVRRHIISNIWFPFTTEREAQVVSYLSLMSTADDATTLRTTGIYTDRVARTGLDGGWVITARHLTLERAL